jgi:C-3',4' desaturase CrtD
MEAERGRTTNRPALDRPGPRRPTPPVDLVVIGAGIGGLTAAALAAHDGFQVLVLERHTRPGGCAGDFALDGLLFPAGATLLSGFEPGGLHNLVYRRLGLRHRAVPLDRAMEIIAPDQRLTLWTDRARWEAEWRTAFPGAEAAKARFFRWAERTGGIVHRFAARLPVLPLCTAHDLARSLRALRPEVLRVLPDLLRTVERVLHLTGAATDPRLVRFIDGQLLDATGSLSARCPAVTGAIALDFYHRGCFVLPNGSAEIALDLVGALRRDGGEVRYQTEVTALHRTTTGTWLVVTATGDVVEARAVVANVPAWDLPALLGPATPRRLRAACRSRARSWGAFVLHAAVDPVVLPAAPYAFYQTLPPLGEPLTEGRMCFITVLPARKPGGLRPVSVSTHTEVAPWWRLERSAYEERKAMYMERLIEACARALPGFRRGLRWARAATPRTYARYTGRRLGLVGGLRIEHPFPVAFPSHRTGLPGLYLAGDTVFPGQGTIGVTLSGINAYRSVRDALRADQRAIISLQRRSDGVRAGPPTPEVGSRRRLPDKPIGEDANSGE